MWHTHAILALILTLPTLPHLQAALLRSEKLYDQLEKESYSSTMSSAESETIFREHVGESGGLRTHGVEKGSPLMKRRNGASPNSIPILTRPPPVGLFSPIGPPPSVSVRSPASQAFSDWVPVCQLGVLTSTSLSDLSSSPALPSSLSYLAREVCHSASLTSSFPRSGAEFAAEPLSSFFDHVYDAVVSPAKGNAALSPSEARAVLGVEKGDDPGDVKRKYRKITLANHPDRFVLDPDSEEAEAGARRFSDAAAAYEVLSSSEKSDSYYEGLGGKARSDFTKVQVEDVGKERTAMRMELDLGGYRAAVRCLDPDVSKFFVARNSAR